MEKKQLYSDNVSDSFIEMYVDDNDYAWIISNYIDPENGKMYVLLLKEAITNTINKYKAKKYRQYVQKSDWESFIKYVDGWNIINMENDILLIECDINSAAACIIESMLKNNN